MKKEKITTDEAFKIHSEIQENELLRRKLLAENARRLTVIRENKLYKIIEGNQETEWAGYLSNTSIYYSRNQVENLINIVKKFEEQYQTPIESILDIPMSRLVDMLPIEFVNGEEMLEYLSHARTNLPRDWAITIRGRKGLKTSENCEHDYKFYEICSICGERHPIDKHAI